MHRMDIVNRVVTALWAKMHIRHGGDMMINKGKLAMLRNCAFDFSSMSSVQILTGTLPPVRAGLTGMVVLFIAKERCAVELPTGGVSPWFSDYQGLDSLHGVLPYRNN